MSSDNEDKLTRHLLKTELENQIDSETNPEVIRRLCFIRNLYEGDDVESAAQRVGISESIGREWRERWNENGLAAFRADANSMLDIFLHSIGKLRFWLEFGKWKTLVLYFVVAVAAIYISTGPSPPVAEILHGEDAVRDPQSVIIENSRQETLLQPQQMTFRGVENVTTQEMGDGSSGTGQIVTIQSAQNGTINTTQSHRIQSAQNVTVTNQLLIDENARVTWEIYLWTLLGSLAFVVTRPIQEERWNPYEIRKELFHIPGSLLLVSGIYLLVRGNNEVFVLAVAFLTGFSTKTALSRVRTAADNYLSANNDSE